MNDIIEISKLTKYFGKHRGVESIDLTVQEGDFFGFIGPNGAGKSTTIRILLGLIKKDSGVAKVFGQDSKPNQKKILSRVGYMPSEAVFYPNLTVKNTLQMSAKLFGSYNEKEIDRLLELFKLDSTKKVKDLSLGNRKKIAIISAIQHHPELYILDEPTSGLDPLMQLAFWDELQKRHQEGATIFVSSHILSEVQRYCQKAAIIREGKIVVQDMVSNLSQTSMKHVRLDGIYDIDLQQSQNLMKDDHGITFDYTGEISELINYIYLHQVEIEDFNITQPDIETIFMHYYQKNGEED